MLPRIAYVTGAGSPVPDPDLPLALAALARAGLDAEPVAWDAEVDWADFDMALVRASCGYPLRRQEFLRWARRVEDHTCLVNPALTLARNTDRTYLRDLQRQGVETVDTIWLEPGDSVADCEQEVRRRGWAGCVVSANVGGEARIVQDPGEAARLAAALGADGMVGMLQPHLPGDEQDREVSVVVFDGKISHAVSQQDGSTRVVPQLDDAVADVVLEILEVAAAGDDLLYARVDLVRVEGQWLLRGLEATGPRLFLDCSQAASDNFAHAVRHWLAPEAGEPDYLTGSG